MIADLKDRGRDDRVKDNFLWLKEAGIGLVCTSVDDPKEPLKLTQDSSFFRLFMNDVGLLSAMYMDNVQYRILSGSTDINNGSIFENFRGFGYKCGSKVDLNAFLAALGRSGLTGVSRSNARRGTTAPPKWSPKGADWFFDEKKSGGVLFGAHVHDVDYILGTFGRPRKVLAAFHRNPHGYVDHTTAACEYRNALITSDSSFAAAGSPHGRDL